MSTGKTVEHLSNGLNLGVIEGVLAGIGIDVQGVDGALVSSVECSSGVCRISDEAVNGVGHLVTEHGELVHGQSGLVLSVDALVSDQACSCDHVGGHTVTNEQDDVLGLALLSQVADQPGSDGLGAIVVSESCSVLARLVERNTAVSLRSDIDDRRLLCILGKVVY